MFKTSLKILGLLLLVVVLATTIRYALWRADTLEAMAAQSHIVDDDFLPAANRFSIRVLTPANYLKELRDGHYK